MEPAVRVALTGRSRVYTTDDFDDSRREASNRADRPRLSAVPTAEFQFGNPRAAVNPHHRHQHQSPLKQHPNSFLTTIN